MCNALGKLGSYFVQAVSGLFQSLMPNAITRSKTSNNTKLDLHNLIKQEFCVCVCVCVCVCLRACVRACACVCVCVCACVCDCVCKCVYECMRASVRTCLRTCVYYTL